MDFTPTSTNKDVFASYIFCNARCRFNLIQTRLLYRLVEFAQSEITGQIIARKMVRWQHDLHDVRIQLPAKCLLSDGSKHYEDVKASVFALQKQVLESYDSDRGVWRSAPVIFNVSLTKNRGVLEFSVADWVWDNILDFSRGFRRFELGTLLSLKSPHAMRMYSLVSGQTRTLQYGVQRLKELFGIENKYAQTRDFIKKVIEPTKKELDNYCPYSFTWSPIKEGRKVIAISIHPVEIAGNRDDALEAKRLRAKVSVQGTLGSMYFYMVEHFGFTKVELARNEASLSEFYRLHNAPLDFVASLSARYRTDRGVRGKGWVIAAIKDELKTARGVK